MPNQPLIEIHIPCFNEEKNLPRLFESLENQTYKNLVVVIHDNNSCDETPKMVSLQALKYPNRYKHIRYLYTLPPDGQGQRICKYPHFAEYISVRSANDFISPTYYEKIMDLMLSRPNISLAYSHGYLVYDDDLKTGYRSENSIIDTSGMDRINRAIHVAKNYTYPFSLWGVYRRDIFSTLQRIMCYGSDHVLVCEAALFGDVVSSDSPDDFRIVTRPSGEESDQSLSTIYNFWDSHHYLRNQGLERENIFMTPDIDLPMTSLVIGHHKMIFGAAIEDNKKLVLLDEITKTLTMRFHLFFEYEHNKFLESLELRFEKYTSDYLPKVFKIKALQLIDDELTNILQISPNLKETVSKYKHKISEYLKFF